LAKLIHCVIFPLNNDTKQKHTLRSLSSRANNESGREKYNTKMPISLNTKFSEKPNRWLITGGCGFIGLNLVKSLLEEGGHYIRIVDNLSVGSREDLSKVCEFKEVDIDHIRPQSSVLSLQSSVDLIVADILNEGLAVKAAADIDIIVHLAANTGVAPSVEDPRSDCLNNVVGTLNYLEAARQHRVKRFIFASSGAPVGECHPPIHEESVPHPVSPYGASKLAGEGYCSAYYRTYGLETVALRFGNVYGPLSGQKNSVVARFIKRASTAKPLEIYGDGYQTRDFIFVGDLVRAIELAATGKNIGGELFQIATNSETTIRELVEKLLPICNEFGFNDVIVKYMAPRTGDVRKNFSNTSKARNKLGWQSEVDLYAGLRATLQSLLFDIGSSTE
jgi:UDP-glucose 4-epimerase